MIATVPAADISPHSSSYCETSPAMPTGSVVVAEVVVRMSANRNSFQARMIAKIAVAARPDAVSGSTMRTNTVMRLQPSTSAASSSSTGTSWMNARIIQVTNGRLKPV